MRKSGLSNLYTLIMVTRYLIYIIKKTAYSRKLPGTELHTYAVVFLVLSPSFSVFVHSHTPTVDFGCRQLFTVIQF